MTAAEARCGNRLPIEHATLICGRKEGHDGEHRCTRADGSMTGWADVPSPSAAAPDPRFRDQLAEALCELRNGPGSWDYEPGRPYWRDDADALLPLIAAHVKARVQAEVRERAAEAVREFSLDAADRATVLGRRGPNAIADWLLDLGQDTAAALTQPADGAT